MNNDTNQACGQQIAGEYHQKLTNREAQKPWGEIPIEQKLERLREELLDARRQRRWEMERFGRVDEKLRHLDSHQHGHDGTVMVRARDMERGYGMDAAQQICGGFDPLA